MKEGQVSLITAFGRGETLALALHENGFHVQVLDFTSALPAYCHRGVGPFPIIDHSYLPAQREFLNQVVKIPGGLDIWLSDGPLSLTGPMHEIHAQSHPELNTLKGGVSSGEFREVWLERFLRQWASPFYSEPWADTNDRRFSFEQELGVIPADQEERAMSLDRLHGKAIDIRSCLGLRDARLRAQRVLELEVDTGTSVSVQASQWIWALSSFETNHLNASVAKRIFFRGIAEPEWAWMSFEGSMQSGPWCEGMPQCAVVIGDPHLPWTYANAIVLRRIDATRMRYWLKVPRNRLGDMDARRAWALSVWALLMQRLPLADWKVEPAEWSVCSHSEVYQASARGEGLSSWKNWDWIAPQSLPRLDLSARLEREAASFRRLVQWRSEQMKKQGVRGDQTLHAP